MNWIVVFCGACAIFGLVTGTIGLKTMRSRRPEGAELAWEQPPLSTWRYETPTMVAISIHSVGLFLLTAFVMLGLSGSPVFPLPIKLNGSLLLSLLAVFAVFHTAYVTGVTIAYHFTQPWIRPVTYGIANDGMRYDATLIDWKSYSHYERGPDVGQISLYSSYSPSLRTWVLQPPAEFQAGILALVEKNLPSGPAQQAADPWHSPLVMILGMAAMVMGALLPVIWSWLADQSLLWIYAFLAFFFLNHFGIQWLTRFDGRGHSDAGQSEVQ